MRQWRNWGKTDPRYLAHSQDELEEEFWAIHYYENYIKKGQNTEGLLVQETEYDGSDAFVQEMRKRGIHIAGVTDTADPWDDGEDDDAWESFDPRDLGE